MLEVASNSGSMGGRSSRFAWALRDLGVRVVRYLGVVTAGLFGCSYEYEGEFGGPEMTPYVLPPAVYIFNYRVTNITSGAVLTEGCGAVPSESYESQFCARINVRAPLESEYQVELKSIRRTEGTLSPEQNDEHFCSLHDTQPVAQHINPICYRSKDPVRHELLAASLIDPAGNELPSDRSKSYIDAIPGDVERYQLKAHRYLDAYLTISEPCGIGQSHLCLVSFLPPD